MKRLLMCLGLLLIFFVSVSMAEDSELVKASKKEKMRRSKVKAAKTFTNKDIEAFRAKNKTTGATVEGENQGNQNEGAESQNEGAESPEAATTETDKSNDEAYWKDKYKDAADHVQEAEQKIQKLQDEMNALKIAFYAEEDGVAGRPKINSEIEKQFDQIEVAKKDLETAKQQLEDLEEDARKAGVPPGWVRE
jgi:DNA repair exonuclease SbcCD ATPase subunit